MQNPLLNPKELAPSTPTELLGPDLLLEIHYDLLDPIQLRGESVLVARALRPLQDLLLLLGHLNSIVMYARPMNTSFRIVLAPQKKPRGPAAPMGCASCAFSQAIDQTVARCLMFVWSFLGSVKNLTAKSHTPTRHKFASPANKIDNPPAPGQTIAVHDSKLLLSIIITRKQAEMKKSVVF